MATIGHAYRCENGECTMEKCSKMKKFRRHMESHVARFSWSMCMSCRACKYVILLSSIHPRACRVAECPVPYCTETKLRLSDPSGPGMASAARDLLNLMSEFNVVMPSAAQLVPDLFVVVYRHLQALENSLSNDNPRVPQCSVCTEDLCESRKPTSTPCGHVFCEICINDCLSIYDFCPKCQETVHPGSCIRLHLYDRETS